MTRVEVASLSSQVPAGVLAADGQPLRLSWRVANTGSPAVEQLAYEVEAAATPGFESPPGDDGLSR